MNGVWHATNGTRRATGGADRNRAASSARGAIADTAVAAES
ncbi:MULTISPECIES: hypothetical protein [unclassified Streptomyces]